MGYNNGYESGYADAIEDVRNGKVAGLGPASGGGEAVPATRAAGLFYLTGDDETLEIAFDTPSILSGGDVGASELPVTFTLSNDFPMAHVAAPSGGWVPGDAILFHHNNSLLAGIDRGDTVPDDATCANISSQEVDLMLMRLADTWTLFSIGSFN